MSQFGITPSWQWQLEQAVLCFKVGRRFGSGGFLGTALALTPRCSRPRLPARRLSFYVIAPGKARRILRGESPRRVRARSLSDLGFKIQFSYHEVEKTHILRPYNSF
jgi:hypothetical protein